MIDWSGKRRWIALLLLLAGIGVMIYVPPVIPVIQLPGEVYPEGWKLFGLIEIPHNILAGSPMTNTMMGSIIVWILLILLAIYVSRVRPKSGSEVPRGGFYNFFEMGFELIYDFLERIAGGRFFDLIFKMFMTIFLIVLLSNWMELVPGVDSIGFLEPHIEEETGETLDGYETYEFLGTYTLDGQCVWISPEEAETLTEEEMQDRAETGCVTGTGAAIEEEHEGEEEAATETESTEAVAEEEETEGEQEATAEQEGEGAAEEHHPEPGSPTAPWVVLPYVRAPSTDLSMTLSIALISVFMTQVVGFQALGLSYLTKFFNFRTLFTSPLGAIDVAVGLLELVSEFAKILSFSFRLLGNIFAGSILLFVMSFLIPFLPWPFFILEFFVGIIQAVVFALLTAIFMNLATIAHHEHDEEHEAIHES